MSENCVRAVIATCEACNRSADVNVDALPETVYGPHVGQRLKCRQCAGKAISTRYAWHSGPAKRLPTTPDAMTHGHDCRIDTSLATGNGHF